MNVRSPAPRIPGAVTLAAALLAPAAFANECATIDDDAQRLVCYDRMFRPTPTVEATVPQAAEADRKAVVATRSELQARKGRDLVESWDLDPTTTRAPFEIKAYKPMHMLVGTHTDNVNREPSSDHADNTVTTPLGVTATEVQYQISFKSKVWEGLFNGRANLWLGYTQSSRWQLYNSRLSRPFRETNYEPEAMLVFRTPYRLGEWQGRLTSIGINHQSNGRELPLSRSWNRLILQTGLETDDSTLLIRPWWRMPESAANDDNPHIQDYVGRGEVIYAKRLGGHVVSLQGRHSLLGGRHGKGSLRVDWSIPVSGFLKAHLSLFSGYGESLIDFNHRQTMVGLGISLVEWR